MAAIPQSVSPLQYMSTWTPGLFIPYKRQIGGIVAQVTIEETGEDDLQITEHPVEQGAPISDHAFKRPSTVTIRAGWAAGLYDLSAESGVYGMLLSWQAAFMPFNVITGKRTYTNMLMERLSVTTDQHSEFALMAQIVCRQVIIVNTKTTQVATSTEPDAHGDPAATGPTSDGGDKQAPNYGSPTNDPASATSQPSGTGQSPLLTPTPTPAETTDLTGTSAGGSIAIANSVNNQMAINGAEAPANPPVPSASDLGMKPGEIYGYGSIPPAPATPSTIVSP